MTTGLSERFRFSTYVVLLGTAAITSATYAPQLLGAAGLIEQASIQGVATLIGMFAALPLLIGLLTTVILSIAGWLRGPRVHRIRLLAWWTGGVGGCVLATVIAPLSGFDPYVGTAPTPLGFSDAVLVLSLGFAIALPCCWMMRAGRECDAA